MFYADKSGKPDVGINSWLEPPGNTYETTDIWVDSPVNGYGTFRYPYWSDLMGNTVPSGNGDRAGMAGWDAALHPGMRLRVGASLGMLLP